MGRRRKTPKLVTQYLENVSREALESHFDIVRDFMRRRNGVYALFRKGKLYYVGLASDLRGRLKHHLGGRHGERWDAFSVYLTIGDQHMRELESLILRIAEPPGNKQLGKFAGAEDIWRRFDKAIEAKQRIERDRILGVESEEEAVPHLIRKAISIRARRKGKIVKARLRPDLTVRWNGRLYNTPSAAGRAVRKKSTNGWSFWHYQRSPGDWVPIDELRNR
jgi:hypothetical protein